jgi:hypothetical protein
VLGLPRGRKRRQHAEKTIRQDLARLSLSAFLQAHRSRLIYEVLHRTSEDGEG